MTCSSEGFCCLLTCRLVHTRSLSRSRCGSSTFEYLFNSFIHSFTPSALTALSWSGLLWIQTTSQEHWWKSTLLTRIHTFIHIKCAINCQIQSIYISLMFSEETREPEETHITGRIGQGIWKQWGSNTIHCTNVASPWGFPNNKSILPSALLWQLSSSYTISPSSKSLMQLLNGATEKRMPYE